MDLGFRAQDFFWVWVSGFRKLFSGRRARAGKLGEYVSPSFHGAARAYTGALHTWQMDTQVLHQPMDPANLSLTAC